MLCSMVQIIAYSFVKGVNHYSSVPGVTTCLCIAAGKTLPNLPPGVPAAMLSHQYLVGNAAMPFYVSPLSRLSLLGSGGWVWP